MEYYDDGTARIQWGNGRDTGYINKEDLSVYLGSNDWLSGKLSYRNRWRDNRAR